MRLRLFILIILAFFSTWALAASRFMRPQPLPDQGPWFEGWYVRVVDPSKNLSFAVLAASANFSKENLYPNRPMPGLVSFIMKPSAHAKTFSEEQVVRNSWIMSEPNYFAWHAPGVGFLNEEGLVHNFSSGLSVKLLFGQRKPWSRLGGDWGPSGFFTAIRAFPTHWYVDSLGTPTEYAVTLKDGTIYKGVGFAHVEKNWGRSFPDSWIWSQATSDDGQSHFVLAGGAVPVLGRSLKTYVFGYRSPKFSVNFYPNELLVTHFADTTDGCHGRFTLRAVQPGMIVLVDAEADPGDFAPLTAPKVDGFISNFAHESFGAKIRIRFMANGRVIESAEFRGAALEFVGGYRCQQAHSAIQ